MITPLRDSPKPAYDLEGPGWGKLTPPPPPRTLNPELPEAALSCP